MSETLWLAVLFVVVGPLRAAVRLVMQIRAIKEAHVLGSVRCPHCGHEGPLYGYATFFAQPRLRCAKCKRAVGRSALART